jgi:hypothetical protein
MSRTANATYQQKIACLIMLAHQAGHPFVCAECGRPILPGQQVQFDHRHADGRGGPNVIANLAPLHSHPKGAEDELGNPLDCHYRKTFRPRSLATGLGSDNYEAKKAPKMAAAHAINKLPPGTPRAKAPARAMATRKFPTQQRGFAPRGSRPMNRKRRAG